MHHIGFDGLEFTDEGLYGFTVRNWADFSFHLHFFIWDGSEQLGYFLRIDFFAVIAIEDESWYFMTNSFFFEMMGEIFKIGINATA